MAARLRKTFVLTILNTRFVSNNWLETRGSSGYVRYELQDSHVPSTRKASVLSVKA